MSRIVCDTVIILDGSPADVRITRLQSINGTDAAVLHLGDRVTVRIVDASPELLDRIAEACTELADFRRQQTMPRIGGAA